MATAFQAGTRKSVAGVVRPALIIAVPFYKNEHLVDPLVRSLSACAAEIREINACVLLFNDSPDYPALGQALDKAGASIGDAFPAEVRHNQTNIGWLKTCNIAMQEAREAGADVLLFNSDTFIFPGALREMVRVSKLDPMIGFINPRSNNATLATLPSLGLPAEDPATAREAYRIASRTMPAVSYIPTAVGFAMWIRHIVLEEFGYFDEIYGGGYNEENDLVMRAGRCGYRAVMANHAFVLHQGEASLGATDNSKELKEAPNREILLRRYPEYMPIVNAWFSGPEYMTEQLVSALVPGPDGKLTVGFDFSSFAAFHSGTHKAGMQFLNHAKAWKEKFNVVVLCSEHAYDFHGMAATGVPRREPYGGERYAALFRVGQPFDWDAVRRQYAKGAIVGTFMLDTIAIDCSHLYNPGVFNVWQHVIDYSDFIAYNSVFTAKQFDGRFANVQRRPSVVSMHSVGFEDYQPDNDDVSDIVRQMPDDCILVVGNHYPHKTVGDAANRIAKAYPDRQVVALGVAKGRTEIQGAGPGEPAPLGPQNTRLEDLPNLNGLLVGKLSDADVTALQRKASVIVMPSYYEGFGMPILTALVLNKPIFARRIPPVQEIHQKLHLDPNLHLYDTTTDLIAQLETPPRWQERPEVVELRHDGDRLAGQILEIVERCISEADYSKILARVRTTQTIADIAARSGGGGLGVMHATDAESAAYRFGRMTERMVRPIMKIPGVYRSFQLVYRAARFGKRTGQ